MKRRLPWLALLIWVTGFVVLPSLEAQRRPYIGYTYPAGAQQGTTCQIKLGGQDLDDVNAVLVTGTGVSARVVNYYRRLNNQELQLLRELRAGKVQLQTAAGPVTLPEHPVFWAGFALIGEPD